MAIESLYTACFRNLADQETNTAAHDIFLVGENGQGKTNFLEALYFCCYASSFRASKDAEIVRQGENHFAASAVLKNGPAVQSTTPPQADGVCCSHKVFDSGSIPLVPPQGAGVWTLRNESPPQGESRIRISWEKQKKSIEMDGKKLEERRELLQALPCVVFCHEDMDFVSGSHERRRWFFDQTQSLYDPVYLDDLRRFRRVLKSRNTVLREIKTAQRNYREASALLDALDPQLAEYGLRLMEKRRKATAHFSGVFAPIYNEVAGIDGISVSYEPSWRFTGEHIPGEKRETDEAQGITVSGPHRDRYQFRRTGREFAASASTGQRRLLALLLRTAQIRCFSDYTGKTPLLLLDDVLLELDGEKRRRFLEVMPDYQQAFFTFLPDEPFQGYRKTNTLVYHVSGGVVSA